MKTPTSCIINESNYLSAPRIAEELDRDPVSIYRTIKRLGIAPSTVLEGGFKFYNAAAIARIEKGMRRRNGHTDDVAARPRGAPDTEGNGASN